MARVVITAMAFQDLERIMVKLAVRAGWAVSARYDAEFTALFERLQQFPGTGAPRPKLGKSTRIGIISPYVVIYDVVGGVVTVLRVVHGRRKITRKLTQFKSK